jgi:hypothetical protein
LGAVDAMTSLALTVLALIWVGSLVLVVGIVVIEHHLYGLRHPLVFTNISAIDREVEAFAHTIPDHLGQSTLHDNQNGEQS